MCYPMRWRVLPPGRIGNPRTALSPKQALTVEYNGTVNKLQDFLGRPLSVKEQAVKDKLNARLGELGTQLDALEKGNVGHMPGSMTPEARQAYREAWRNATFSTAPMRPARKPTESE
jgi:hypothetical protein